MAERSYLWDGSTDNSDTGDVGPYNEETWRSIFKALMGTSLIEDAAIIPDSGLGGLYPLSVIPATPASTTITVTAGSAIVFGTFYENTTSRTFTIPDNNDTNVRIDTIAIRWDSTTKTVRIKYLGGVPSTNPVAATLANTSAIREIPIAYITVDSRFTSIGADKIQNVGKFIQNGSYDISILKNSGSSTIQSGYIVEIDPSNDRSIRLATTPKNAMGVSIGDIPASQFGLICTRGILDVYASSNVTRGEDAVLATTNGTITSQGVVDGFIIGKVLETTSAAGYASVLFSPSFVGRRLIGDAMERTTSFLGGHPGNGALVTDLTPPSDCRAIYIMWRQRTNDTWVGGVLIDYAVWNGFTEVADRTNLPANNSFQYQFTYGGSNITWRVGKGTGGVIAVSTSSFNANHYFDRICVRWIL